jgi:predicted nucleic acid-binding protein
VQTGIIYARDPAGEQLRWRQLLRAIDVLDVTAAIADIWAQLRGFLRQRGQTTGDNDLLIAATALQFGLTVITRNKRQFGRVPGLDVLIPEP